MSGDRLGGDSVDSEPETGSFPDCPNCGSPIAMVTMTGPTDGVASPCGCHFVPGVLD